MKAFVKIAFSVFFLPHWCTLPKTDAKGGKAPPCSYCHKVSIRNWITLYVRFVFRDDKMYGYKESTKLNADTPCLVVSILLLVLLISSTVLLFTIWLQWNFRSFGFIDKDSSQFNEWAIWFSSFVTQNTRPSIRKGSTLSTFSPWWRCSKRSARWCIT